MTKEAMLPKTSTYLPKIGTTFKDSKGTKVSLFGQKDGLILNVGGKEAFFGDGDAKKLKVFIDHLMMASNYFLDHVEPTLDVDSLIDAVVKGDDPEKLLSERAFNSAELQRILRIVADDHPKEASFYVMIADRLNQSFPGSQDVSERDLLDILLEPGLRKMATPQRRQQLILGLRKMV